MKGVYMYTWMQVPREVRGSDSTGSAFSDICKPPDAGAENQTQAFRRAMCVLKHWA